MAEDHVPWVHLMEENRLDIRTVNVCVDEIPGGGAQVNFMLRQQSARHARGFSQRTVPTTVV